MNAIFFVLFYDSELKVKRNLCVEGGRKKVGEYAWH
jgi:hypothetical protein